jgi:hypothetical protein
MRVAVLGFGSVWRQKFGKNLTDARRFQRGAYYNTTGVVVNGHIRTRPRIIGHIRFNGIGGFNPNYPSRMLNRVFECEEPCIWKGQFKMLFKKLLPRTERPDYFLVAITHLLTGHLSIDAGEWKSDDILVISFSEWRDQQEALLLMPAYSWLRSQLGTFVLAPSLAKHCHADLSLRSTD